MKKNKIYLSTFNSDSSETVAYNNPLFPVYVQTGQMSAYPDYAFITHWHQDLEFVIVLEGHMTYSVNGILTELKENDGFMVNSRQIHSCFSKDRSECKFVCILLSPELFRNNEWFYESFIEPVTYHTDIPYLKLGSTGWQKEIIDNLRRMVCPVSAFEIMELSYHIMGVLYDHLPEKKMDDHNHKKDMKCLKDMLLFMNENYADHLTLGNIASSGACCTSKCCALFKKYLHDTPVTYLTKFRLRKSLDSLLKQDVSITDIALNYGFNSSSYYCELFHRYYEMSPLQYRKDHLRK